MDETKHITGVIYKDRSGNNGLSEQLKRNREK
jgi:hypothetical protein